MTQFNITIYARTEDRATIERAKKLLAYHEDISLSEFIRQKLKEVVERCDQNEIC